MTYTSKQTLVKKAHILALNAVSFDGIASDLREKFSSQFGDNGGLNKYPVSGGICDHWPRWAKDEVIEAVHESQDCLSESLRLWELAGRRAHTWRRHCKQS